MTINAILKRLVLTTPQPQPMAEFYQRAFGYRPAQVGADQHCEAQDRSLWLRNGPGNQLAEAHFMFPHTDAFASYEDRLASAGVPYAIDSRSQSIAATDPEGRTLRFFVSTANAGSHEAAVGSPPPARIQHFALRSPDIPRLLRFYVEGLGFVVSDLVLDAEGAITAAFLRTDAEHHSLALFRAATPLFDHFSCEAPDWTALRDWADHMGRNAIEVVWGIGRHGPGNDTFFMVRDPDGNLAEISSDLEVCAEDRPAGQWPHQMTTLNLWGLAIMRS